jgi:hypothetical protein
MMDGYKMGEALYIGEGHAIVDSIDSSLLKASQPRRYQNLSTHEPQYPVLPKVPTSSMVSVVPQNFASVVDFAPQRLVLRGMLICRS